MGKFLSLLGLVAVFFAFVMAETKPVITHDPDHATAAVLASGVFTIALAAILRE